MHKYRAREAPPGLAESAQGATNEIGVVPDGLPIEAIQQAMAFFCQGIK
jgi:hypothetical protein